MLKTITAKDIGGLTYIRDISEAGLQKAIQNICKTKQLTEDFIREFSSYITPELFSNSPGLTYELIEKYPELFDETIWKNSENRSLYILMNDNFRSKFTEEEILNFIQTEKNVYEINEDLFYKLYNNYTNKEIRIALLEKYKYDLPSDFLIKNVDYLTKSIFENKTIKENLSTEMIEEIFKNKSTITMEFFTMAITSVNDIAWQEEMCDNASSGKIAITQSGGTFDIYLKYAIRVLHEDVLIKLFALLNIYDRNAISYSVLEYLLKTTDMSEELCLELMNNYKENNLVNALGKYAVNNDYYSVITGLAL